MNFSCTDAKVDTTETVELSDFGDYKKAMFLKEKTGITKSIETSDSDFDLDFGSKIIHNLHYMTC